MSEEGSLPSMLFNEQGILVVGDIHGIGGAVAVQAAQRGATVVFNRPPQDEAAAVQILDAARAAGVRERVCFVPADVSSEAEVDRLFDEALEHLPALHVLVNSTGSTAALAETPLSETSLADWNQVLGAYLREAFWVSRRAVDEFLGQGEGGRIVHLASAAGSVSYAAAQAALRSFVRSVAKEYGPRRIACNALVVQGGAEAAAEMALFLASAGASFVNGEAVCLGAGVQHQMTGGVSHVDR